MWTNDDNGNKVRVEQFEQMRITTMRCVIDQNGQITVPTNKSGKGQIEQMKITSTKQV